MTLFFTIILTIILFFLMNGVGTLSKDRGYTPIGNIFENINYFGFNLVIRIVGPSIYILFVSGALYYFSLDNRFIKNIWYVIPGYYSLYLIIVIFLGKIRFIDYRYLFLYSFLGTMIGYQVYSKVIIFGLENILPDFQNFKSDMWLIVILFFYGIILKIEPDYQKQYVFREKYILERYNYFHKKHYHSFNNISSTFVKIIISIMIYEDFNRPAQIRYIEKIIYYISRMIGSDTKMTTGVMQVKSKKILTDKESIDLAIKRLEPIYLKNKGKSDLVLKIGKAYNGDTYSYEIQEIYDTLKKVQKR